MAKKRANGEGNIRKRADGRWEGRYTAGYHPETGKRIIKMCWVRHRQNARRNSVPQWKLPEELMSAVRMSTR